LGRHGVCSIHERSWRQSPETERKKKLLKQQFKASKKSNCLSPGQKTLLVILSGLATILLLGLVTELLCNLSCSGAEGAAAIVVIGSTAVIIILFLVVIRTLYRKKKKQVRKESATTG
jgi:hypothetical protein